MKLVLGLALIASGPAAVAQTSAEHLAPPADPAMTLGYAAAARGQAIWEYVPRGETVEDWTRMITVQSFPAAPGLTPEALIMRWGQMLADRCVGAEVGKITAITISGRQGSELTVVCPNNPQTGKPEAVVGRMVAGDATLAVIQTATRRRFTAEDARWSATVLAGTLYCAAGSTNAHCIETTRTDVGAPL